MNGYVELDEKKHVRREVKLQVYNVELITNYLHNM
jgi:DNA-dependent RNA polymerase auxiliary subunit epsilon